MLVFYFILKRRSLGLVYIAAFLGALSDYGFIYTFAFCNHGHAFSLYSSPSREARVLFCFVFWLSDFGWWNESTGTYLGKLVDRMGWDELYLRTDWTGMHRRTWDGFMDLAAAIGIELQFFFTRYFLHYFS